MFVFPTSHKTEKFIYLRVKDSITMVKYEISKTAGGYYRVYKLTSKFAIPFSPREFLNKKDARAWAKSKRIKLS